MNENEKTSKYLVEYFGGCWHELRENPAIMWNPYVPLSKCSCGDLYCSEVNPDLFTWPGFGWLKDELEKAGKWMELVRRNGKYVWLRAGGDYEGTYCLSVHFIDPITFPTRVEQFLKSLKIE